MEKQEVKKRIEKLRKTINHHRYLYHVRDSPEISDAALDSLKHELKKLEDEFPGLITPDSPTQRVGGEPLKEFKKLAHGIPMLSLEDVFSKEEVEDWISRNAKIITVSGTTELFAEMKFDGLALSLIYKNGEFERAATRGDGKMGEDVTQNIKTIEAVPLRLETHVVIKENFRAKAEKLLKNGTIEIRGEVLITKKDFQKINTEQKKAGKQIFANPRNLAAGSVRQLDPAVTQLRRLDFHAYDLLADFGQSRHSEEHEILSALGFKTDKTAKVISDLKSLFSYREKIAHKRPDLEYEADGIVVSVNDNNLFRRLGVVGKAPRGAIAFKFAAKEATTVIEDILVQVGRTGAVTPVAILKPVSVGGVTVSRATLHNADEIKRLDVQIGDTVIVGRAGDVIPDIKRSLKDLRPKGAKEFRMPKFCPVCGRELKQDGVILRCINPKCSARHRESLYHFVSRVAFDIEGLGPKIIDALLDNGLIRDAADLFELKEGDIRPLERFGEKSAENLVKAISLRREIGLARFVLGLGILHVGEETALDLAEHFGSMRALEKADKGDLEKVPNIGTVVSESVYKWFREERNKEFLERLLKYVKIKNPKKKIKGKFKDKTFVLTGSLESMSRDEAKAKIRELGGNISETVSKNTDFVIVGFEPGSKHEKAKKLGIKIINEREFLKIL
ncbi:MAG: NAD-dependent DNA ligase LigA [Patescibacteria group bacterium]